MMQIDWRSEALRANRQPRPKPFDMPATCPACGLESVLHLRQGEWLKCEHCGELFNDRGLDCERR